MKLSGNTILITGGGSGIGMGLAQAFHAEGNSVVVAGRRAEPLQRMADAHPGMAWRTVDMGDAAAVHDFAQAVAHDHPELNVLVNNAGIMRMESLTGDVLRLDEAEEQVAVNLMGPIRLSAALLPHIRQHAGATLMNVSSGLAFVPISMVPTYCATKAAIHSYTLSQRRQLAGSAVQVIELVPPAVAPNLMPPSDDGPPTMPLQAYINAVMAVLRSEPVVEVVLVDDVKPLRLAEAKGCFNQVFELINAPPAH